MRIIPRAKRSYAHIEWEASDEARIRELQQEFARSLVRSNPPPGLRIEVSENDAVPDNVRKRLLDGRFFVVE